MRWKGRERSQNVEDRRGVPVKGLVGGGGLILVVIAILTMLFGGDPKPFLDAAAKPGQLQGLAGQQAPGEDDEVREFIEVVLKDTENVWTTLLGEQVKGGQSYRPPALVIFSGVTATACGQGNAAMGPFYCPADKTVYIDPSFFDELSRRHKAPGDFRKPMCWLTKLHITFSNHWGSVRRSTRCVVAAIKSRSIDRPCDLSFKPIIWLESGHITRRKITTFWRKAISRRA